MLGTFVNVAAVIIGGLIGLLFKKGINEKVSNTVMYGVGLCVLYIGISGSLKGENPLITVISIVIGAIIGELSDLDDKLRKFSSFLENKFSNKNDSKTSFSQGFIAASLLFCVGAMAIVGSLHSGLTGNHEMLFTKSLLDFISAIIFASTLGAGVLFSSVLVFIYQGGITLSAEFIAPYLSDRVIAEMTCVGSILIIALALNLLKITKIKVLNYIPGILLPVLLCIFM